jgi:IS30 family transposase
MAKTASEKYFEQQKKKEVQKKKYSEKTVCRKCAKNQSLNNYYDTTNEFVDKNGKMSICKSCIYEMFEFFYSQKNDLEYAVYATCVEVDLIFHDDFFEAFKKEVEEQKKKGTLTSNIGALFGRYKSVVHREFSKQNNSSLDSLRFYNSPMFEKSKKEKVLQIGTKDIDDEIIKRFGDGFTPEEYISFQEKWDKLSPSFNHATKLHTESFTRYIVLSVQGSNLLAEGEWDKAKKVLDMAAKAAEAAKITPKQMSEADLQGGLDSFCELSLAVEKVNEISPILPKHKHQPNDALDFILWRYINAVEDIKGIPHSSYEDMYKFYDERVKEYVDNFGDPFGMFKDDPTVGNRENVKKFIEKAGVE